LGIGPGQHRPGTEEALSLDAHGGLAGGFGKAIGFDHVMLLPGDATLVPGRQRREGGFGFSSLIPEGDTAEEIGPFEEEAVFGDLEVAFVFDGDFEGLGEIHGVGQVPAVADAAVAGGIALPCGLAEPGAGADAIAPGVVEVVFGAGALQAGDLLAVDVKVIIAFAEPAFLGERDRQDGADVIAAAFDVGQQVILPHDGGVFLAIAGVEIRRLGGEFIELHPIDLPVQAGRAVWVVVGDDDAGIFAERHPPVAGQRAGGRDLDGDAVDDGGFAVADGEEITDGDFDARGGVVIVIDTQRQGVELPYPAGVAGKPDMGDDAGAFEDRHVDRLAGHEPVHVEIFGVPAGLFVAGDAAVAAFGEQALRAEDFVDRGGETRAAFVGRVVDPDGVVHVGAGVFIGHPAVATAVVGVSEDKQAAAGLLGVVAIADQQDAVAIDDAVGGRGIEDVVFPDGLFGPAETAADRPLPAQDLFDLSQVRIGQAGVGIPFLDPVQTQVGGVGLGGQRPELFIRGKFGIVFILIRHVLFGAGAMVDEAFPDVGEVAAVGFLGKVVISGPVEVFDAEARRLALLFG